MHKHAANWSEIRKLFSEARDSLPHDRSRQQPSRAPACDRITGTLEEFEEFLEHNELELAWDALAELADRLGASKSVWQRLAQAAALMQLVEKRDAAARRAALAVS